jgi:hypothetical protein
MHPIRWRKQGDDEAAVRAIEPSGELFSIDGRSTVGWTRFWIFVAVFVPATLLIGGFPRPFGTAREATLYLRSH